MKVKEVAHASQEKGFNILVSSLCRTIGPLAEVAISFDAALQELIRIREILTDKIVNNSFLAVPIDKEELCPGIFKVLFLLTVNNLIPRLFKVFLAISFLSLRASL